MRPSCVSVAFDLCPVMILFILKSGCSAVPAFSSRSVLISILSVFNLRFSGISAFYPGTILILSFFKLLTFGSVAVHS